MSSPAAGLGYSGATPAVPSHITYFFTQNIAAELILGVTKHDIHGTGTLGGVALQHLAAPADADLAVSLHQLRRVQAVCRRRRELHHSVQHQAGRRDAHPALDQQRLRRRRAASGFDYMVNANWGINVDVKKLWLDPNLERQQRRAHRKARSTLAGRRRYHLPLRRPGGGEVLIHLAHASMRNGRPCGARFVLGDVLMSAGAQ